MSGLGSHQFQSPRRRIVAGTSTSRTIVASTKIATERPTPSALIDGAPARAKAPKTATMISAAAVIVRALAATFERLASGIVLTEGAAEDLGLRVGDTVTLSHPVRTGPTRFRTATSRVEIVALHPNPLRGLAYMASGQAGRFGLAGAANAVELRPRGSQEALTRDLFGRQGIAFVESGSAVQDAVRTYLDDFLTILRITQLVTLLLAILIAVNTTSIATEERRREHATMLAFGVPPPRTLGLAIVESALIGVLGTIVGLALGLAVLGWIINVVSRDTYPELGMPVTLSPTSVAVAAALGIVVVALAPLLSWRRLARMDVPAALRVVE